MEDDIAVTEATENGGEWISAPLPKLRAELLRGLAEVTDRVIKNYENPEDLLETITAIPALMLPLTGLINMARLVQTAPAFIHDNQVPKQLHVNGMFILSNDDLQRMAEQLRDVEEGDVMNTASREASKFFEREIPVSHISVSHDHDAENARAVLAALKVDGSFDDALTECLGATLGLAMLTPTDNIEGVMLVNEPGLFGSHRVTLFQTLYFFYTMLCCAKALVWDQMDYAKMERDLGFNPGEFPNMLDPFWLTRAVQARRCGRLQYRGGDYSTAVAMYSVYFAHSYHVRMPLRESPAEKMNEAMLRMAYFHRSVHLACEWADGQQWTRAVYEHESPEKCRDRLNGPGIYQQTELLLHMVAECGTLELDFNSKRQLFDLTSVILRCHGDASLFAEMHPFLELQPVVVLDLMSSSPWRQFCKHVDSKRPHAIVEKPGILTVGVDESIWSWEIARSVLCLFYIYLFDFVVCATPGEGSFTTRCIKVFPDVYPAHMDALNGSIQIVGSNFYVRYGNRFVDCGNDPKLLVDVMFMLMISTNNAYKSQCQKFHIKFHSMRRTGRPGFERTVTRQSPYKCGVVLQNAGGGNNGGVQPQGA